MASSPGLPSARSLLDALREKPVFDFFPVLCELRPQIEAIRFATYRRRPGLSQRLKDRLTSGDDALRQAAEKLSAEGVEFWDALLSLAMQRGVLRESFVEAALLHNFNLPERNFELGRERLMGGAISTIVPQLSPGEGLLVRSQLRLGSGAAAYLPMLDFSCPCRGGNAYAIQSLVEAAGAPEGVLVRSGQSYHFYGIELLSEKEWLRFMALALLFAPVTDSRYNAHRLLDGECRLKIVDSEGGKIPVIEEAFGRET